jgi:hypothetical protein
MARLPKKGFAWSIMPACQRAGEQAGIHFPTKLTQQNKSNGRFRKKIPIYPAKASTSWEAGFSTGLPSNDPTTDPKGARQKCPKQQSPPASPPITKYLAKIR